jgi:hypothetical protein
MGNMDNDACGATDDALNSFCLRFHDEAIPNIAAATVPIYGFQDNQVKQDRTGVLFQIADSHFIMTAAHGLDGILREQIPLLADFSKKHRIPIPLVKARFHYTEEKNGRDVAAIELPPSIVAEFLPERRFLTMADVDTEPRPQNSLYLVFGFPNAWYRRIEDVQTTDSLCFLGSIYDEKLNPDTFFDTAVHITLGFDQRCQNVLTQEEKILPKIHGISGCGIWRLINYSAAQIDGWNPSKIRLVAIQHRWFERSKYIQGTWITYVLRLIWDKYPSLREAMKLTYPKGY